MTAVSDLLPDSRADLHDRVADNWVRVLVAATVALLVGVTLYKFAVSPFYVSDDSALFQHGGWYIGQGATLYVDIWDLKPPLIYAVTTVLAFLSFGNMALLHVYSVVAALAAVAGGVVLLGRTVYRMTGDGFAGATAGFSVFALTSLYAYPFAGIRPKYFAFLCGAAALYLAVGDRYLASGVAAALGAGFWQLGGGIALLVVAMALQREGRAAAARTVAGGLAVAVLTVLPFVLTGTALPLFVEAVIVPVYGVEQYTIPARLLEFVIQLGYGALLLPVGAYGWYRGLREDPGEYWWVAAGGVLYLFQIFLEFQGAIEMVLVYLFLALGVGLLVAHTPTPSRRTVVAGAVVLLVVATPYWHEASATPVKDATIDLQERYDVPIYDQLPPDPPDAPSMQTIYWEKLRPDTCHYRLGDKQKHFEAITGGTIDKERCGQWPFDQPPLQWLLDVIVPFTATAP